MSKPLMEHGCWQCSGCHHVFFMDWRKTCPSCKIDDHWSGSVDPDAKAKALRSLVIERQQFRNREGLVQALGVAALSLCESADVANEHDDCDCGFCKLTRAAKALRDFGPIGGGT